MCASGHNDFARDSPEQPQMSLDLTLWLAMGGAAFFYHFAASQKANPALFLLISVAISVLAMLLFPGEWIAVLLAQGLLFLALTTYQKFKG
jgi:hypothetical protein